MLPTTADGLLLTTAEEFEKETKRFEAMQMNGKILIEFCDRPTGSKWPKKIRFTTFTLSTVFPNNVCVLQSGSIIIVRDIVKFPKGSGEILVIGQKFLSLCDAFKEPFLSSQFGIHIASKLNGYTGEWNIDCIAGKMYAVPYKLNYGVVVDITDPNQMWYVTPLHHTFL